MIFDDDVKKIATGCEVARDCALVYTYHGCCESTELTIQASKVQLFEAKSHKLAVACPAEEDCACGDRSFYSAPPRCSKSHCDIRYVPGIKISSAIPVPAVAKHFDSVLTEARAARARGDELKVEALLGSLTGGSGKPELDRRLFLARSLVLKSRFDDAVNLYDDISATAIRWIKEMPAVDVGLKRIIWRAVYNAACARALEGWKADAIGRLEAANNLTSPNPILHNRFLGPYSDSDDNEHLTGPFVEPSVFESLLAKDMDLLSIHKESNFKELVVAVKGAAVERKIFLKNAAKVIRKVDSHSLPPPASEK
jgi:hypothetical protein